METITVFETKPVHVRAHLTKGNAASLQRADVSASGITARLYDLRSDTPHTALSTTVLTTNNVLFDTGLTAGWRKTGTYNFLYVFPGTLLVQGGGHYQVEIEIDGVSEDDDNWIVFTIKTVDLLGV